MAWQRDWSRWSRQPASRRAVSEWRERELKIAVAAISVVASCVATVIAGGDASWLSVYGRSILVGRLEGDSLFLKSEMQVVVAWASF